MKWAFCHVRTAANKCLPISISLKKAEALLARNQLKEAIDPLKEAMKDENNLDAWILKATRYSTDHRMGLETLDEAVAQGP